MIYFCSKVLLFLQFGFCGRPTVRTYVHMCLYYGPGVTWGFRSSLAPQSNVREYDPAWVTWYRWCLGVGILDPQASRVPPLVPVGTPNPMGISTKDNLYKYIHTYMCLYLVLTSDFCSETQVMGILLQLTWLFFLFWIIWFKDEPGGFMQVWINPVQIRASWSCKNQVEQVLLTKKYATRNTKGYIPGKILSPFWCTVPLQYVYKWLITQAMANWITTNIV